MLLDRRRTETLLAYRMEIVNETILILLFYTMMGYGMLVLQGSALHSIGFINIFLLFTLIGVNSFAFFYLTVRRVIR